jgi:hypothetical protein
MIKPLVRSEQEQPQPGGELYDIFVVGDGRYEARRRGGQMANIPFTVPTDRLDIAEDLRQGGVRHCIFWKNKAGDYELVSASEPMISPSEERAFAQLQPYGERVERADAALLMAEVRPMVWEQSLSVYEAVEQDPSKRLKICRTAQEIFANFKEADRKADKNTPPITLEEADAMIGKMFAYGTKPNAMLKTARAISDLAEKDAFMRHASVHVASRIIVADEVVKKLGKSTAIEAAQKMGLASNATFEGEWEALLRRESQWVLDQVFVQNKPLEIPAVTAKESLTEEPRTSPPHTKTTPSAEGKNRNPSTVDPYMARLLADLSLMKDRNRLAGMKPEARMQAYEEVIDKHEKAAAAGGVQGLFEEMSVAKLKQEQIREQSKIKEDKEKKAFDEVKMSVEHLTGKQKVNALEARQNELRNEITRMPMGEERAMKENLLGKVAIELAKEAAAYARKQNEEQAKKRKEQKEKFCQKGAKLGSEVYGEILEICSGM